MGLSTSQFISVMLAPLSLVDADCTCGAGASPEPAKDRPARRLSVQRWTLAPATNHVLLVVYRRGGRPHRSLS